MPPTSMAVTSPPTNEDPWTVETIADLNERVPAIAHGFDPVPNHGASIPPSSLSTGTSALPYGDAFGGDLSHTAYREVVAPSDIPRAAPRVLILEDHFEEATVARIVRVMTHAMNSRAPRNTRRNSTGGRRSASGARRSGSSSSSSDDGEPAPAWAGPPRLVVDLPLEDLPHVSILAASAEDELRLRSWLRRTGVLYRLQAVVLEALDELDGRREAA